MKTASLNDRSSSCPSARTTIVIIADGWGTRLFEDCLKASRLPEIEDELLADGVLFPRVVSTFPSVSIACHTTLLTGVNQNSHSIPGHRWMDTASKMPRNYIGPQAAQVNRDINDAVRTVFEVYADRPSFAVQTIVSRGATKTTKLFTLDSKAILLRAADSACHHPGSLIVAWLPRGDAMSHIHGPDSDQMVQEMVSTSRGIGALAKRLQSHGILPNTQILFTADHGQKPIRNRLDLAACFHRYGFSALINPRRVASVAASIFTSGDSAAYIYFSDRLASYDAKYEVLDRLRKEQGVGLAFLRVDEAKHYVFSDGGIASIELIGPYRVRYALISGEDPLQLLRVSALCAVFDIGAPCGSTAQQKYPDILHQYLTSFVLGRSADVLVTSAEQYHFGVAPRIGWRLGYHRGSHGGPSADEMLFPAIATRCDILASAQEPIRSKDLLKTCSLI